LDWPTKNVCLVRNIEEKELEFEGNSFLVNLEARKKKKTKYKTLPLWKLRMEEGTSLFFRLKNTATALNSPSKLNLRTTKKVRSPSIQIEF
jgi:hypothetical protein